jgi:predicted nucleic acid-binding protein
LKQVIVDASAALALYLKDEDGSYATSFADSLDEYRIMVPPHWWVEVTSGLLMAERRKRINRNEVDKIMESLIVLEAEVIQIAPADFAEKIIPLSYTHKLTSYDACYLYLAIKQKAPLATLDKALKEAANKAGVAILK